MKSNDSFFIVSLSKCFMLEKGKSPNCPPTERKEGRKGLFGELGVEVERAWARAQRLEVKGASQNLVFHLIGPNLGLTLVGLARSSFFSGSDKAQRIKPTKLNFLVLKCKEMP